MFPLRLGGVIQGEIQQELRALGLDDDGTKAVLADRLFDVLSAEAEV